MTEQANAGTGGEGGGKPQTVLGAGGGGQPFDWKGALGDDYATHESIIQGKGWKSPADAVKAYASAQALLGKGGQGGLQLPKDDAPAEDWGKFYDSLGRPKSADEYKLTVPDGQDDTFAKTAATWMHEAGLHPRQASALAGKWNEFVEAQAKAEEEAFGQKSAAELGQLKKEWGNEYDANVEFSKRALKAAGMTEEEGAALERALGLGKAVKLMAQLGRSLREDSAEGDRRGGAFKMSAEDAKARYQANQADEGFRKRLLDRYAVGHKEAVEEQDRLRKISMGMAA